APCARPLFTILSSSRSILSSMGIRGRRLLSLAVTSLAVASCSAAAAPAGSGPAHASVPASPPPSPSPRSPAPRSPSPSSASPSSASALPAPADLVPFGPVAAGQGVWRPAGRPVTENGQSERAVYEITLIP